MFYRCVPFSVAHICNPWVCAACCRVACLFILFLVTYSRVAFLQFEPSSCCSILSYMTFCHIVSGPALSHTTFCRIACVLFTLRCNVSVGNLSSFALLVSFHCYLNGNHCWWQCYTSEKTVFDIQSSSMVTVSGKISMILDRPILGDINLLYKSVTNRSAVEGFIGGWSVYTYYPPCTSCGALQIFLYSSTLYRQCAVSICLSVFCRIVATRCSNLARSTYGDVVALAKVGTAVGASNVVSPGGSRDNTRLKGVQFVEQCSWALQAYVSGCT